MFNATPTANDDFLDPVLMSGLLDIDSGENCQNIASVEHPSQHVASFGNVVQTDTGVARDAIADFESQVQPSFAQSKILQQPGNGALSPVSNEDGELAEKNRLASNSYIFDYGQPPSIQGPGAPVGPKVAPFVAPEEAGILTAPFVAPEEGDVTTQIALASRAASTKSEQILARESNSTQRHDFASGAAFDGLLFATGAPNGPAQPKEEENETQGLFSSILTNLLGNSEGQLASDDFTSTSGGVVLPSAHGVMDPEQFQRVGQLLGVQQPQQRQQRVNYLSNDAGEQAILNQMQKAQSFPCHYQEKGQQNSHARNAEQPQHIQSETQQNSSHPMLSTVSFVDMFQIDSIPVPQPSDWKMSPPGCVASDKVDDANAKLTKTESGRVKKPSNGRRKASSGLRKLSKQKRPSKGKKPGTATSKEKDSLPAPPGTVGDVIPPRMGDATSASAVQPSRFCHICLRRAGRVTLLACGNALEGSCRKVVCEKCFETFGWDWKAACEPSSKWTCTHCREA